MKRQIACKKDAIDELKSVLNDLHGVRNRIVCCARKIHKTFICNDHDNECDDLGDILLNLEGLLIDMIYELKRIKDRE